MLKEHYNVVENEPGWGSFHIVLKWKKTGNIMRADIPALDFGNFYGPDEDYINSRFGFGAPLVAWRYGKRGVCGVMLNPGIQNAHVHLIFHAQGEDRPVYSEREVNPNELIRKPIRIDPTWYVPDERLEMTGTLDGKLFAAIVYYQPSDRTGNRYAMWETQTRFTRPMDIDNL